MIQHHFKSMNKTVLVTSCAVILSACGGGGSSVPNVQPTPVVTNTTTTNPNTTNTNSTANSSTTANNATNGTSNTTSTTNNTNTTNTTPTPSTTTNTTASLEQQFDTAIKASFVNLSSRAYGGTTLTVDNTAKTVTAQANPDVKFDEFKLGGSTVLLLDRTKDRLNYVSVRKLEAEDFINGGFAPKDASNPGYVGSRYGAEELGPFGQMRYGVYTDNANKTHLFVHGKPSDRVFKGKYLGSAIIGKDGVYQGLPDAVTATVSDDLSKVSVAIKTPSDTLNFGGDITGNTFAGTQNGIQTKGGFYGNGDSLGGVFYVKEGSYKDQNGVFGASQGYHNEQ